MPMYLKRDTIRLLEASVESISLAVAALGLPRRYESREPASENSIAIGLAGVSAELAMSAIIVKVSRHFVFPQIFIRRGLTLSMTLDCLLHPKSLRWYS